MIDLFNGKYLFQYRSFDEHTIENIKNDYLVFNNIEAFNDPSEGFHNCSLQYYLHNETNSDYEAPGDMSNIVLKYKISCLTKSPNNLLMWSHYANKHKGYVAIYKIEDIIQMKEFILLEVNYDKYKNGGCPKIQNSNDLLEPLKYKSYCWKYEEEFRIVIKSEMFYDKINSEEYEYIKSLSNGKYCYIDKPSKQLIRVISSSKGEIIKEYTSDIEIKKLEPIGYVMGVNVNMDCSNILEENCIQRKRKLMKCKLNGMNNIHIEEV